MIKSIVGHTDSISSLSFGIGEFDLISGSHDGFIRSWDLRNYNLLNDVSCHRIKNNEGVLGIKVIKNNKSIITSGADAVIKGFNY